MLAPTVFKLLVLSLVVAWSLPVHGLPAQGASVYQGTNGPKKPDSYIVTYESGVNKEASLNAFKLTHPGVKVVHNYDARVCNSILETRRNS